MDILARDRVGRVVIELKAGTGDIAVIGQVLSYVVDLLVEDSAEPVRGMVIATISRRARSRPPAPC